MTNPILIDTPFASNGKKNTIQDEGSATSNRASWDQGWSEITSRPIKTGGMPPEREDFNGVLFAITDNITHQSKGLGYEFDADFAEKIGGYPVGARLRNADGDEIVNTVAGNKSNMAGWHKNSNAVESIADLPSYAKKGQVVYVNSYYPAVNGTSQPYSGGDNFTFFTTTETEVQGLVIKVDGGYWKRKSKDSYSIDDFGAHPSKSASINSNAINIALSSVKNVCVPTAIYNVNTDAINLKSGNHLFGLGTLQGQDPNTTGIADVSGTMLRINGVDNAKVSNVTIKNGYKAKGVWMTNSKNITFEDVCIDGFSYGAWCGEDDDFGIGCQNIKFIRPRILNTRYWGIYVRCLDVTDDTKKTKNIWCENPYFYNCGMAGFVCAEGHVNGVALINPVFERCNVSMHFESCTDYTVINPRDYDTGKKPDHVPANTEYPYIGYSLYQIFTKNSQVIGGKLESTVWFGGAIDAKSHNHLYNGLHCKEFVFEGVGANDTNKDIFKDYTFSNVTTDEVFIYQQAGAQAYLKNFTIDGCTCLLGEEGDSGTGVYIAMNQTRCVDMKITNNTFYNSTMRIKCEGSLIFTGNTFFGTDDTQSQFTGGDDSSLSNPSFLQFTGNIYKKAGGTVVGDSAILIQGWTRVKTENTIRANLVNHGYRFTDNRLIEMGYSWVYDTLVDAYVEGGTTSIVYLFRE